jgi:predicted O-methyltransferase YrrM
MYSWAKLKADVDGALSEHECAVLASEARSSGATNALEVGHYMGLSTCVLLESLPPDCALTTIDHHEGDEWSGPTLHSNFVDNVTPYIRGRREFRDVQAPFADALSQLDSPQFDFVFYDADHTAEAVAKFWAYAEPLLLPRCTLVFDDADWDDQATMFKLAEQAGFDRVDDQPHVRHRRDKKDPMTYTLGIMVREGV